MFGNVRGRHGWLAMLVDRIDNMVERRVRLGWDDRPFRRGSGATSGFLHHRTIRRPSTPATSRRRPHHGGGRLSPRRRHVARHPGVSSQAWGHLPVDELRKICCENAAQLLSPSAFPTQCSRRVGVNRPTRGCCSGARGGAGGGRAGAMSARRVRGEARSRSAAQAGGRCRPHANTAPS